MPAPKPRRVRLKEARQRNRRRFDRLEKAGLVQITAWVPTRWIDAVGQRATALDVHRQTVLRAAIEVGLRHLTTSDVIRTAQTWQGIIKLPIAARYPGEKTEAAQCAQSAG